MSINLQKPDIRELKPKITVFGVGGGGGNAVNNMINGGLQGVEFVVANTDAQALIMSKAERVIQLGVDVTQGLGAGSQPEVGRAAAEECIDEIADHLQGTHMAFVTAGMGGGTGTGAAPVVARAARELGILTVGVVTKPFHFEGGRRMKTAEMGICELQKNVDTLIVIPNQNLFRLANDKTTFADAFGMADQVLYSGVACITDLMVKEGLINLDFADVRSVMREMGKAMMGTGEASGEGRAMAAAEAAISNPLLDETTMRGARGLLISITGGRDLTLFEVDEAATRIREEVDSEANIILGATFEESLEGVIRVSVVATGIDRAADAEAEIEERRAIAVSRSTSAPSTMQNRLATAASGAAQHARPVQQAPREQAEAPVRAQQTQERAPLPAAAPVERDGVSIAPFRPEPTFLDGAMEDEFREALESELSPANDPYIPPSPELPEIPVASTRMPEVEDFPPIVQAELEQRIAARSSGQDERGPMGLLKKLAHGFGAREHEEEAVAPTHAARPVAPQVRHEQPALPVRTAAPAGNPAPVRAAPPAGSAGARPPQQMRPAASQQPAREQAQPPVRSQGQQPSHGAPRAAAQPMQAGHGRVDDNPFAPMRPALDRNGRITAVDRPIEDDQLDIPAFLRRQSS